MSRFTTSAVVFAVMLFAPAIAQTQASIAGTVTDTSRAVLAAVTVEVSSPALTQVRTVTTDQNGQYRIADLPAGTYTVVFTLPGFATLKREGLELNERTSAATLHAVLRRP